MDYVKLPKIDLHCHLDGSVRPKTLIELAHKQNVMLPSENINEIKELMVAPATCQNLTEYIKRFDLPVSVMQTEESLERISFELFEDAAKENVKYLEVRFGPQLHNQNGLSFEQIIGSVIKGMNKAEKQYDIKGNYILSMVKFLPSDTINEVIDAGAKYLNQGVVAFDLAGSELDGFCQDYVCYAQYAIKKGYKITIHAGEQGNGQNVYDAIALLGAQRIGHGIAIEGHKQAYDLVKKELIALETCPSSNTQTKAVKDLSKHPINTFYKEGVMITINTDNRTVSDTTMSKEVRKVMEEFNLSHEDYFKIYKISVEHSFASESVKQSLLHYAE